MTIRCRARAIAGSLVLLLCWGAAPATPAAASDTGQRAALYEEGERAKLLVVRLTGPNSEGAGILFHLDDRYAYGVTARHVVFQKRIETGLEAHLQAWPGRRFPVEVPKLHHEHDLAVFKADLSALGLSRQQLLQGVPLDQLGASADLDPGDPLTFVGHSTAGAWITPKSPVKFARGEADSFQFETDCPQGHSGGGVFDRDWRLVGMMIEEERPYCRALRIEPILRIVQTWKLENSLRTAPSQKRDAAAPRSITVAVVGFDNSTNKDLPALGNMAQDITTGFLHTLPGVVMVTRDRLDKVRNEIKLPGSVLDGTGVSRAGNLLNADVLVTGSIIRYDVERRTFNGFGTSALQDIFRMAISLQILDVKSGRVQFSKTFDVDHTEQYPKATSAPSQPIDLTSKLLNDLLALAQSDVRSALSQVAAGLGTAGQFLDVAVTSSPAGADIILNGAFIGKTPRTLQLSQDSHEIRIELAGHESWRNRVKVQPGTRVDVHLSPRSSP